MKPNKRAKNARKQISDIYLEVVKLSDFLSELQLQAEREFVNQEDSHELADEYIILFQGHQSNRTVSAGWGEITCSC